MKCYIGIDLGGTVVKIGLVSGGSVLGTRRIEVCSSRLLEPILPDVEGCVNSLLGMDYGFPVELAGVALSFAGIVNVAGKKVAATNSKYEDAPLIDLEKWVFNKWGVPFVIDNDARMAMLGEWQYGAGIGISNMVMMTIGTGIGTGVVVDSRPLYGKNCCAGSLGGHMIVDYQGRKCTCGNVGCVESHASSFFLPQIIKESKSVNSDSVSNYAGCDFKALFDLYRSGDKVAEGIIRECMDVWSAAIVNYIHAYDPEMVVLGGGVMKSADVIIPYLQEKVDALVWNPGEKVKIVSSKLGDNAAILASEYYFTK